MILSNYVKQTDNYELMLIAVTRNQKNVHTKIKESHGMVIFVSMNALKNPALDLITCVLSTGNDHQSDKINVSVIKL